MADAVAVMDAHGMAKAHLVGMSLGGYICQMLAVEHPQRVATLTLLPSEPLGWDSEPLPSIDPAFLTHFAKLADVDWESQAEAENILVEIERLSSGGAHEFDEARSRETFRQVWGRATNPASMFNHGALDTCTTGPGSSVKSPSRCW